MNDTAPHIPGYELTTCLGQGGYAEVWLGWRAGAMDFMVPVAIKVLNLEHSSRDAACRRFFAEARLLSVLNHPGIINVIDAGLAPPNASPEATATRPYYVMPFLNGASVATLLARQTRLLPIDAALYIGARAAMALHAAHAAIDHRGVRLEVVHRDVNPTNVLIGQGGRVKLIDFGIAVSELGPRETRVNIIKGNPRYMSPEQAFGAEVDARSDIYSLGLTLFEILTGRAPLAAKDQPETLALARQPKIAPPSFLRPALGQVIDNVVLRALSPRPNDRYRSMHHFGQALYRCLAEVNPQYLPESLDLLFTGETPLNHLVPPQTGTLRIKTHEPLEEQTGTNVVERLIGDDEDTAVTRQPTPAPEAL